MPYPKGKKRTSKSVEQGVQTRQYTLLKDAKLRFKGKQTIGKFGSIIDWDSLILKRERGRTRRFVLIVCGTCRQSRSVNFHNLIKQMRYSFYTGCCKKCADSFTWFEEGRSLPERRKMNSNGYIKLWKPDNPMADKRGEVYEHRFIMSQILGRPLKNWEHVHHKDNNRANNSPENLELVTTQENQSMKNIIARITQLESLLKQHHIEIPQSNSKIPPNS